MKYKELVERFRTESVLTANPKAVNTPYKAKKELLRMLAIDYQYEVRFEPFDMWEYIKCEEFFKKNGKRYGLLEEFRENAII